MIPWAGTSAYETSSGQNSCRGSAVVPLRISRAALAGLAFADEQPYQAALSDRARREVSAHADEPVLGGAVVHMVLNEEGDEHVRVEKNGH